MNWSSGGLHRIQSTEIKCNTRGSIRTQNFCLLALFSSCLFVEIRNTVPSWNLSLLSPGYLVVMAVRRTGFCFHFLLSLPLISSYLWGIRMCHRLPWALPRTFHEQQRGFDSVSFTGNGYKRTNREDQVQTKTEHPVQSSIYALYSQDLLPHIFAGQRTAPH